MAQIGDEELADYHGQFFATTLYMSAETLHLGALAQLCGLDSTKAALARLMEDVLQMIGDIHIVCQSYQTWFLETYIVPHHPFTNGQRIALDDAPLSEEVFTPFFLNFDDLRAKFPG
ncbi:hypothetical protein ATE72_11780 [Sphingopyxis sp. HXXIV]|nr:hypothetical protein ATE72_11780 [Sphingopyxis sp. HXXIV]